MATVADQLRAAREARMLTIQQAADATKIRTDHIRALESGNYDAFPAPVYIRGSVKNYATLLKLNVPQVMVSLDEELAGTEKFSEPPPLMEQTNSIGNRVMYLLSKLNWRTAVIAGAVVGVVLLIWGIDVAIRHHRGRDPLAGVPPATYQSTDAGDTLPLPQK
ncbi:MAG TPA: helix-turn-helix transcriptional regulator [Verrucomicrobiae bacterium]|nr:helix-turn-helix transcriptional regulator [Verrucomicrobiae bacterium]